MNPNIAQKWVAALRSGEYFQGHSHLRNLDNTFCCLGVLCDLHARENNTAWDLNNNVEIWFYDGDCGVLPDSVQNWAEMKDHQGKLGRGESNLLTNMNDSGKTFAEIANIIEKSVEIL